MDGAPSTRRAPRQATPHATARGCRRSHGPVLLLNPLPASLTWEPSLKHQERLTQTPAGPAPLGPPRDGVALWAGILVCGTGGRRRHGSYRRIHQPSSHCLRHCVEATEPTGPGVQATVRATCVAQQVLRALEPAAFALRLQARQDVERERARRRQPWQQPVQRARDDRDVAARRSQAGDPANRLVAATLEQRWEEALRHARQLQEASERCLQATPPPVQAEEWARMTAVASALPALWQAAGPTKRDRQALIRCLVDRVVASVQRDSDSGQVAIQWAGGSLSHHEGMRPVRPDEPLRHVATRMRRLRGWRTAGATPAPMATTRHHDGLVPPKRYRPCSQELVGQRLARQG